MILLKFELPIQIKSEHISMGYYGDIYTHAPYRNRYKYAHARLRFYEFQSGIFAYIAPRCVYKDGGDVCGFLSDKSTTVSTFLEAVKKMPP